MTTDITDLVARLRVDCTLSSSRYIRVHTEEVRLLLDEVERLERRSRILESIEVDGEIISTCDWGDCDNPAADFRYAVDLREWLTVCVEHTVETERITAALARAEQAERELRFHTECSIERPPPTAEEWAEYWRAY